MPQLFYDGFETVIDCKSPWSGTTTTDAGCTVTCDTTRAVKGLTALKCLTDGASKNAYIYEDGYALDEAYFRFYYNMDALPADGKIFYLLYLYDAAPVAVIYAMIRNVSGVYTFRIRNAIAGANYNYTISIAADEWHCFEFRVKRGDADGIVQAWYDDVLVINRVNVDTNNAGNQYEDFQIGNRGNSEASTVYIDEVVIAEEKIGLLTRTGPRIKLGRKKVEKKKEQADYLRFLK